MRTSIPNRNVEFIFDDGDMIRVVSGGDGRKYTHRCSLAVYEKVAWLIEEAPGDRSLGPIPKIAKTLSLPFTQVDVAMAFLDERGIIERIGRRHYRASAMPHLDAMTEWHALREVPNAKADAKPDAKPDAKGVSNL